MVCERADGGGLSRNFCIRLSRHVWRKAGRLNLPVLLTTQVGNTAHGSAPGHVWPERWHLSERWLAMPPVELKSLVQEIVDRITVAADRIEIQLSRAKIAAALQVGERGQRPDLDPVVLSIEAKVRRAGKGKRLVTNARKF